MRHPILDQVDKRLKTDAIPHHEAAAEIGVTTQSLVRHLAGEYVRSDSLAKYRLWLERNVRVRQIRDNTPKIVQMQLVEPARQDELLQHRALWPGVQIPPQPHRVVDIFSGCGGLSLGFERYENGRVFDTTLALDVEEPMIRVFNDNHPSSKSELPRGRQADVTDFLNETEIQTYYLDHLARSGQDPALVHELKDLAGHDLNIVRANLRLLDQQFLDRISAIRSDPEFPKAYRKMGGNVLGQTSVLAFHRALKLPFTALGQPRLETLLWSDDGSVAVLDQMTIVPEDDVVRTRKQTARRLWDEELQKLKDKAAGTGTGQLSSSAKRIRTFQDFITGEQSNAVRIAWVDWRARRDAIRMSVFDNPRVQRCVQALYNQGRQVSVLLGGPPCQGFSRIGRGKIRSLREQSVHVHEDEDSGDSRNQLLEQYVLFVSALSPRMFLFENVRHFQAVVKIGDRKFDAGEALAEAIKNVTSGGLTYDVASRIVDASEHLVPQVRERYLMVGVRNDVRRILGGAVTPDWCITLPVRAPVPLEAALEGLPEPAAPREETETDGSSGEADVFGFRAHLDSADSAHQMRSWISDGDKSTTDGHIARRPRADDAAFFDLMGPGKRWMDYRCDSAPTLKRLAESVEAIRKALSRTPALAEKLGVTGEAMEELGQVLDGSLSLRLMLESIPPLPGEPEHHLLAANYLKKKEGQHGDWLARMDPSRASKTMVSHMGKDTYAYVHPTRPRTLSVREAARIQTFPDSYRLRSVGLVDGFRIIGNAVPPLLSAQFAERIAQVLWLADERTQEQTEVAAAATQPARRANLGA